ncbi:hypothetical protein HK096_002851 [Nowakowskiella sp. JEL0078]|nr:hypothetical protein HK096_002851 [Nowakowskiella sp. JEL0078]
MNSPKPFEKFVVNIRTSFENLFSPKPNVSGSSGNSLNETRSPQLISILDKIYLVAGNIHDEYTSNKSNGPLSQTDLENLHKLVGKSNIDVERKIDNLPSLVDLLVKHSESSSTSSTGTRETWKNQSESQIVQPLKIWKPLSLNDKNNPTSLVSILSQAILSKATVKAVGSGHSYSNVAVTTDFHIDTHGLNRVASDTSPITGQLLPSQIRSNLKLVRKAEWESYNPENNHALFETEAGIVLSDLNKILVAGNLALINMGGYDGQTVAGVISTSTHGSGIGLQPFPDMVKSLVLATTGIWKGKTAGGNPEVGSVQLYRIEPTNGITDPQKYHDPEIALIQDDVCFNAAICSMGCFGVIYSVVLEVSQSYFLGETKTFATLDQALKLLEANESDPDHIPSLLRENRHIEIYIIPYASEGDSVVSLHDDPEQQYSKITCIINKRNIVPPGTSEFSISSNPIVESITSSDIVSESLIAFLNAFPNHILDTLKLSLNAINETKVVTRTSYETFAGSFKLNENTGVAVELAFSLESQSQKYTLDHVKNAVKSILKTAENARVLGNQFQTSPISLRFVKKSSASLSMMSERNTCMIELPMLTGTYALKEVLKRHEIALLNSVRDKTNGEGNFSPRIHWGLEYDVVNGSPGVLDHMYPKLKEWKEVYQQFNSEGTFSSPFTERMGFAV